MRMRPAPVRAVTFASMVAVGLVGMLGCSDCSTSPSVGSNSNWLRRCSANDECGASLLCQCGTCSIDCRNDSDCDRYANARCVLEEDSSSRAQCRASDSWSAQGTCRPRCEVGSCSNGQACALGACVPLQLPDVADCVESPQTLAETRVHEDELIDIVEQARLSSTIACSEAPVAQPQAPLRLDGRLYCAARLIAADLAASGAESPSDASSRPLVAAGYTPDFWAVGYGTRVRSASEAWPKMLKSNQFCSLVSGSQVSDIGVAVIGNSYVVTVGSESL